jgi:hypothetical protein
VNLCYRIGQEAAWLALLVAMVDVFWLRTAKR